MLSLPVFLFDWDAWIATSAADIDTLMNISGCMFGSCSNTPPRATCIKLLSFSSTDQSQDDSKALLRCCSRLSHNVGRNLQHGSVGWLQEEHAVVPKTSGLICTAHILTMQTHMVSFDSFFLSLSPSFFCWSSVLSSTNHAHTLFIL